MECAATAAAEAVEAAEAAATAEEASAVWACLSLLSLLKKLATVFGSELCRRMSVWMCACVELVHEYACKRAESGTASVPDCAIVFN